MRSFIWEFPLTACFVSGMVILYPTVMVFFPTAVDEYFLATPGELQPINWILSTFFHGSFAHLFSNMFFLLILGRVVEYRVGRSKWLLFYFMAGFLSVLGDWIVRGFFIGDRTPVLGASGAISGLASVAALLSPFRFPISKKQAIPFPVFLFAWFMIYSDMTNLFARDHVAHWAHIGGFFSVFVTAYMLSQKERSEIRKGFLVNFTFFTLTVILLFFINNR
ncbi:rhomboid family intramembrane serine protease [Leptospira ilyithenensis]|uniref:Rhomboid family intramembrane serine protease n=1 Tax=Leptospira ilyithenensis TaxID=2484901 RepID=A0A4R9LPX2_9LEPT|nr:rhomboid family intramembrane serine protease [Leptospira ilyithenensis]TGN11134.1 rhomboid family intramembrane serine protease [Leptospira ilyithenensis]